MNNISAQQPMTYRCYRCRGKGSIEYFLDKLDKRQDNVQHIICPICSGIGTITK